MGRRHAGDDRFFVPLLNVAEASLHLGIPGSTIRYWTHHRAGPAPVVHTVPSEIKGDPRLPLVALVETQVLRELRRSGLSLQEIRAGVEMMRSKSHDEYVLASNHIASDGGALLWNVASSVAPEWVRARDGQRAFTPVIEAVTKYVHYAPDTYADRLVLRPYDSADVIIDPRFGWGRPVLERSKVPVDAIAELFYNGGESVDLIADEYGITPQEVESVVRVYGSRRAA
jgi:uncharacterized protein (DUF433 family)